MRERLKYMSKINKTMLNKFNKEIQAVSKDMDSFESEVINVPLNKLEGLREELKVKTEEFDQIKIDGIKDTVKFLTLRNDIQMLEKEIETLEETVSLSNDMYNEFCESKFNKIYDTFLKTGNEETVDKEFRSNMLVLQNEMFKKFLEIEEICNKMDELGSEYRETVCQLPHERMRYHSYDTLLYKNRVHQRFNVRSIVGYYTGITDKKEDFEY